MKTSSATPLRLFVFISLGYWLLSILGGLLLVAVQPDLAVAPSLYQQVTALQRMESYFLGNQMQSFFDLATLAYLKDFVLLAGYYLVSLLTLAWIYWGRQVRADYLWLQMTGLFLFLNLAFVLEWYGPFSIPSPLALYQPLFDGNLPLGLLKNTWLFPPLAIAGIGLVWSTFLLGRWRQPLWASDTPA